MANFNRRELMASFAIAGASLALPSTVYAAANKALQDVVKAAEAEGELALLGPPSEVCREVLMEFQDAYPRIKVKYTSVSSSEWYARLSTERRANLYLWDVLVSGASGTVFTQQLRQFGWYDPVRPLIVDPEVLDDSKWLGGFEAGFLDSSSQYLYAFQAGLQRNTYIDRSKIPLEQLSKLEDLLDPRWKGKIALFDPRLRGGGHIVTLILLLFGEAKARQFLNEQEPVVTSSHRQIVEWAIRGVYPITSGMFPADHAQWQARGIGLNVQPLETPLEQTAWTPGQAVLMYINRAPHPNAAKLYVNWLLSRETQEKWATRGLVNSRRLDVPAGLDASKIDLKTFTHGIGFNTEKYAELALKSEAISKEVLG